MIHFFVDVNYSNAQTIDFRSGGSYAIIDGGCQGLITAAMLDRMQGNGIVWNVYSKGQWQKQAVTAMNFNAEQLNILHNISLVKFKEMLQGEDARVGETPAKIQKLDQEAKEKEYKAPPLEFGTLDGVVIACRRPESITKELLKLLAPSRHFVVYCPYIEVIIHTVPILVRLHLLKSWYVSFAAP